MDKLIALEVARRFHYRRKAWYKRNAVQYTVLFDEPLETLIFDEEITTYIFEQKGLDPETEYTFRFQDYILVPEEHYGPMASIVATTKAGSYWLERESLGLGVLDSVFSGRNGLASNLTRLFGGTAVIAYQHTPGGYDERTGLAFDPSYAMQRVAFTDETYKYTAIQRGTTGSVGGVGGVSVGGVQVSKGDLVGIVAAYDLDREITQNNDLIQWSGRTWRIVATEKVFSGKDAALVRILGSGQYEQQFPE